MQDEAAMQELAGNSYISKECCKFVLENVSININFHIRYSPDLIQPHLLYISLDVFLFS